MSHIRLIISSISVVAMLGCQDNRVTMDTSIEFEVKSPPENAIVCNYNDTYALRYPHECEAGGGFIEK